MHILIKKLLIKKLKKKLQLLNYVNLPLLKKKKNIFLINYQKGIYQYYYTGIKLKKSKFLLNIKINLYREKDKTFLNFLLNASNIIYFF